MIKLHSLDIYFAGNLCDWSDKGFKVFRLGFIFALLSLNVQLD